MMVYRQLGRSLLALLVLAPGVSAETGPRLPLAQRVRGAEAVFVGRVVKVQTALERNKYGDELIVSHVMLEVEETLKGSPAQQQVVAVEGGTYGGYTLRVSDMPEMKPGYRAVFMTRRDDAGVSRPHMRGQGILGLDAQDRVPEDGTTLADLRALARTK